MSMKSTAPAVPVAPATGKTSLVARGNLYSIATQQLEKGCRAINMDPAVEAILSVMPLDTFVPDPACRMEIVGDPDTLPPVQREVQQAVDRAASKHVPLLGVERFAFYERAKSAFAIVPTGERRFYGCFIFKKGVVPPE